MQRDVKKQAEMLKKIKGKKPIDLLRHYKRMAHDNIKDIIACGFNLEKTYIFQDGMAMGYVAILDDGARACGEITRKGGAERGTWPLWINE